MSWTDILIKQISGNGPLLCEVCRSPQATGGDFAKQKNIDRLLKAILSQLPVIRKIYDRGKFGRSPGGGKPRLPPERINSC